MKLPSIKLNDIYKAATHPKAYSIYASIGVIATAVVAVVATNKYQKEKDKISQKVISENLDKTDERIEKAGSFFKSYWPLALTTGLTIHSILKAEQGWIAYNNTLNTAYVMARDKMARYRDALGGAALGASAVPPKEVEKPVIVEGGPPKELWCLRNAGGEDDHDIWFRAAEVDVYSAMYHLNRNFILRKSASVREFLAFLDANCGGLSDEMALYNDTLGWDSDVMIHEWEVEPWIDFNFQYGTVEETGEVINYISYMWEPQYSAECDDLAWGYMH